MSPTHVVCAYRPWNKVKYWGVPLCSNPNLLKSFLNEHSPEWVFFLDWSWKVPKEVVSKYKCVCFHESHLPDFRGGSPIQNQIIHGIAKTKLTAFLMDDGLDTGDILLQEDLSLEGHIMDIMDRVGKLHPIMIDKILKGDYTQTKQTGGTAYARRQPEQSQLTDEDFFKTLKYLYNFIRMLEDPYPNAFTWVGDRKITFKSAEMNNGKIKSLVEIE